MIISRKYLPLDNHLYSALKCIGFDIVKRSYTGITSGSERVKGWFSLRHKHKRRHCNVLIVSVFCFINS